MPTTAVAKPQNPTPARNDSLPHPPLPALPTPTTPQGTLTPFGPELQLQTPLFTDANGTFKLDASMPALAVFPPGETDILTKSTVKFWLTSPTAPDMNLIVNPMSTLVEPYRRLQCNTAGATCKVIGDPSLFGDVYSLFGFLPQDGVNYVNWDGIVMGTKFGLSVYVLNQKVAAILSGASQLAASVCGADFAGSDNPHVQLAVGYALVQVLSSKASVAERVAVLSSKEDIATVMGLALANLQTPEASLQSCKPISSEDYAFLLPALAKVRVAGARPGCCASTAFGVGGR